MAERLNPFDPRETQAQVKKVPFRTMLQQYLSSGTCNEVQVDSVDLIQAEAVVKTLIDNYEQVYVTGKFPFLVALTQGEIPTDGFTLNNFIRAWFIYHDFVGNNYEVPQNESVARAYGEVRLFNSDIDLKTCAPKCLKKDVFKKVYVADGHEVSILERHGRIPSRPWVKKRFVDFCDNNARNYSNPFLRLDISPVPVSADEGNDRRWTGVNDFQIKARLCESTLGITMAYRKEDLRIIDGGIDAYYPQINDPLAKVLITTSRMLLYGAMRRQLGFARTQDVGEQIELRSMEVIREYARVHSGEELHGRRVWQEWTMNALVTGLLEPKMVSLFMDMGLVPFLPKHWREANWDKLRSQNLPAWIYSEDDFLTMVTPARLVQALTGQIIFDSNECYQDLRANQRAMNWMFNGQFDPRGELAQINEWIDSQDFYSYRNADLTLA